MFLSIDIDSSWEAEKIGYPQGKNLSPARMRASIRKAGLQNQETVRIPYLSADRQVRVNIVSPESGIRLQSDPEMPSNLSTVALEAAVDPPVTQVVWYVDGAPYKVVDYPYKTRWPLKLGEHSFQVRLPIMVPPQNAPDPQVFRGRL